MCSMMMSGTFYVPLASMHVLLYMSFYTCPSIHILLYKTSCIPPAIHVTLQSQEICSQQQHSLSASCHLLILLNCVLSSVQRLLLFNFTSDAESCPCNLGFSNLRPNPYIWQESLIKHQTNYEGFFLFPSEGCTLQLLWWVKPTNMFPNIVWNFLNIFKLIHFFKKFLNFLSF